MLVLYFADIFGKPGRKALKVALPDLIAQHSPEFVIGNAENLAGGRGTNRKTYEEMLALGFTGFTSGNHVWDNREILQIMENDPRILRPANWSSPPDDPCPGKGYHLFRAHGKELFVINLIGRLFMDPMDDPFATVDRILKENTTGAPVLVDMHADATSEKNAMGWHLAGRVAAVVGSHSHVQTADERILPGGTAYITDVGMTGAFDSVIGLKAAEVIKKFKTKRPLHSQPAKDNLGVGCVLIKIGVNRKAESIERMRFAVKCDDYMDERDLE